MSKMLEGGGSDALAKLDQLTKLKQPSGRSAVTETLQCPLGETLYEQRTGPTSKPGEKDADRV